MKSLLLYFTLIGSALAQVPAPSHEIYGSVRDSLGVPLTGSAYISFFSGENRVISGVVDSSVAPGQNYSVQIPMVTDTGSATDEGLALVTGFPFTMTVFIGNQTYVPIEFQGMVGNIGEPGERTRVDLTLGLDSDGDGLPDNWEQEIIDSVEGIDSLADVTPDGDADNDGLSNKLEYFVGTYAFDNKAVLRLKILEVTNGIAKLRFLAAKGRSYSLKSSSNLQGFHPQSFSLNSDGSALQAVYLSDSLKFVTIYVPEPVPDTSGSFFSLFVE